MRRLAGNCWSSRETRLWSWLERTAQKISVPPDVSCTHDVSGRLANASATGVAASGAHRMRTAQSERPRRWLSNWPTTRTTWSSTMRW